MLDLGSVDRVGVAGCSFSLVIGALGKLVPELAHARLRGRKRYGSSGQFVLPLANGHHAVAGNPRNPFAVPLLILPLAPRPVATQAVSVKQQSAKQASRRPSAMILRAAGAGFHLRFQVAFTVHLPTYLSPRPVRRRWRLTIGVIGAFISVDPGRRFSSRMPNAAS
jgi:hypothetical protein